MTVLTLVADEQSCTFAKADFPLAVNAEGNDTVVVGTSGRASTIAWLTSHDDGISIQPQSPRSTVFVNDEPLSGARWLRQGDEISIGSCVFALTGQAGAYTLTVVKRAGTQAAVAAIEEGAAPALRSRWNEADRSGFSNRKRITFAILGVLALGAGYVLTASPLHVKVSPEPDTLSVRGIPFALPLADRYLVLPGNYTIAASKEGYKPFTRDVTVGFSAPPTLEFILEKLPGRLQVTTEPAANAKVVIDGVERGSAPTTLDVDAGSREVRIVAERYLPEMQTIEIEGLGKHQEVSVILRPAWATFAVSSVPDKAAIRLDGQLIGETPLTLEALQGRRELQLSKQGWKPATRMLEARGGMSETIPTIELERADGTLTLSSEPNGVNVMVNDQFRGVTPLSIALIGDKEHRVSLSKAGYESEIRRVKVAAEATERMNVQLQPEIGTVFFTASPAGSSLSINGRPSGSGSQRLTLQTVPQTLEIAKPGYESQKMSVTPQKGVPKRVDVTLKAVGDALKERVAKGMVTQGGQRLVLIFIDAPARFSVGSSRRDSARRSNETEYPVELTRSYLISEKEVTNGEYKKFKSSHSSGAYQGASLDDSDKPVVNVSWEDAAAYANWLSGQEGLTPAYRDQDKKLVPVMPLTNGYRLPTEAEWEFAARYEGGKRAATQPLLFAWGEAMPPAANSGNFAHDGTGLPFAIPGYSDAFVASGPVGKFAPNKSQIYDLSGNVAEWCHDYYDVTMPGSSTVVRDPAGPTDGRFHVIKGSSWRSGSATELRFTYRDYADKPRDDLGFRLVRYIDATK